MDRNDTIQVLLWLWVIGVLAVYVYQFRRLVGPILALLGLS